MMKVIDRATDNSTQVVGGFGISADSYYASQGRTSALFDDNNADFFDWVDAEHPNVLCFEMENAQLFHLGQISKGKVLTAAAGVCLAQRSAWPCPFRLRAPLTLPADVDRFLPNSQIHELEKKVGKAIIEGICDFGASHRAPCAAPPRLTLRQICPRPSSSRASTACGTKYDAFLPQSCILQKAGGANAGGAMSIPAAPAASAITAAAAAASAAALTAAGFSPGTVPKYWFAWTAPSPPAF